MAVVRVARRKGLRRKADEGTPAPIVGLGCRNGTQEDFPIYYHLSYKDLGRTCIFKPRIPSNRHSVEDDTTSRICVCSTIEGCLLAVEGVKNIREYRNCSYYAHDYEPFSVYELTGKAYSPTPAEVGDVQLTGELWLLKPTKGQRVGYINMNLLVYHSEVEILTNKKLCVTPRPKKSV